MPSESAKWQYIENSAREICALYNFKEIRTPVFEHTELFLRGVGDTTDIVNKEMYTFNDKGNRSITLKPEGTAGVCRSVIENSLLEGVLPLKTYYFTPVFRYERPQSGRLREHHQFGVEVFGAAGAETDAEIIALAYNFLNKSGITETKLNINSIGCKTCRGGYNAKLREFLNKNTENLCPDCKTRSESNPLRVLDCKVEACKEICKNAPKILDFLCEECQSHFNALQAYLAKIGINFAVNPNIVRGLDYYTKTVFEFVSTGIGAQGTICGGGRYDNLIESLGGKPSPAVGFGMGIERLLLVLESQNITINNQKRVDYFIGYIGNEAALLLKAKEFALAKTFELRAQGFICEFESMGRSVKAQLKYADKINAKYVIIIGEDEIKSGKYTVKDMDADISKK